jgi:DNA ligase D, 3''-phosphoesterase domain/DNA polymerase LigD, ligase domain
MSLKEYRKKRNFQKTAEPPARRGSGRPHGFVVQKHDASRLHYDFRLELNGTLKSWALPKGLPYEKGERHLAVHVEDHPVAYADFEGTIPPGQYGGGTVMLWDRGTYEPLTATPSKDLKNGKLHFTLRGDKLRGEWYLVRLRGEDDQWLIIKGGESMKPVSKRADDRSVLSRRTMKQLARGDRVWQSARGRTRKPERPVPLPDFVEPMKARPVAKPPSGDWLYEIKFDGWRALGLKGGSQCRLLSRNEKDFGAKFPEIMESLALLKAGDVVLDGEIVALDEQGRSSFQLLQAYDLGKKRPPIFYYVFDLLQLDGRDVKDCPIEDRQALLEHLLKRPPGVLRLSAVLGSEADPLLEQARRLGLEGLIGKRRGSAYEAGRRSGAWVKLKLVREQEFVIGGYSEPGGSRAHFGALIVGYYRGKDLLFAGKVGTGFDAKLLKTLHARFRKLEQDDCPFANLPMPRGSRWGKALTRAEMTSCHWLDPQLVCQVKFGEWTRDGHLRQPVFLGLREDKNAREVVRERIHGK